jgi:hypothetical protein
MNFVEPGITSFVKEVLSRTSAFGPGAAALLVAPVRPSAGCAWFNRSSTASVCFCNCWYCLSPSFAV